MADEVFEDLLSALDWAVFLVDHMLNYFLFLLIFW